MFKVSLAALAVTTLVVTAFSASPASAQDRYYDRGYRTYRSERVVPQQYYDYGPRVHGRRDPSSYDGYRTGNPRTCGSDFFRYDDKGVPYGPYCN